MPDTLPRPFGRYILTDRIGEGGMAEVYKAKSRVAEGLSKHLVIKKIRPEFASQEDFGRMFVDEAKIALSLNHANIVQVFDFGKVRDDLFLAMEWIDGIDLMRLFQAVRAVGDAFPPVIAAYIGHQVASALAYAHRKTDDEGRPLGIVHRDVSPHNIMISFAGQVKILDFGIARTARTADAGEPGDARTASGDGREGEETIKGKVAYMSPEQATGRPLDGRSDIYSLGIVLFELLTGELLFRDKDRMRALERVRTEAPPSLRQLAPHVPDALAAIVEKALERDPDDRYPTATAMRADLAAFLHRSDPVVDDEVLAEFVRSYTQQPDAGSGDADVADALTRELADSVGSIGPSAARGGSHRVIAVRMLLDPRPIDGVAMPPSPSAFASLVRNVAVKREAVVLDAGETGALVVFGGLLATEDDPDRAVRFARTIRDELAEVAPGYAMGTVVASVPATVTNAGGPGVDVRIRPDLCALLDRVARHVLDGPIVVGQDVADRLAGRWRFGEATWVDPGPDDAAATDLPELVEPVRLLGPARSPRHHRSPLGRRGRLIGRELERKVLRDALTDAIRSRESRAVLVVGPPGMGKRALLDRFLASLPRTSCFVLRAAATWSRRNVPLGAFLDMLTGFLDIAPDTPRATVRRTLERYGIRDPAMLADVLAVALGLPDRPDVPMAPQEVWRGIWRLLRRLVRSLDRRRPVIVVLENAHFLDPQSLELLAAWNQGRQAVRLLGLVTARPGANAQAIARLPTVSTLELGELDPRARRDLVLQRFESPEQAESLADAILSRTGGNPLFIEETLARLVDDGTLGWSADGRFLVVRRPVDEIRLPPTVEEVLRERIDDLDPADREVLQAASILGRVFDESELQTLLDRAVEASLVRLERGKFIERDVARPGRQARFGTVSLHEVVRETVAADQAALWHGAAADIIRARPTFRPGRDDGVVADHLVAADRSAEAVDHALSAARHAAEIGAQRSAHYYLSLALDAMSPSDPRRFEALRDREEILRGWGKTRDRARDLRTMAEIATASGRRDLEVVALLRLLRFYIDADKLHRANQLAERIERLLADFDDAAEYRPGLARMQSTLALAAGRFDEAERIARAALDDCRDDDAGRRRRARLLAALGKVRLESGDFEGARASYDAGLSIARALGDRRLEAELENALGEVAGRSSHYQEAIDRFKASLDIDRELGDRIATGRKLANLGITYAALGLYRHAERYLRHALDLHERLGRTDEIGDVVVHLGEVEAELGDPAAGRTLLSEAARLARRRGDVRTELRANTRWAYVLARFARDDDDRRQAAELAAWALERSKAAGLRTAAARAHHVEALLAEHAGDIPRALAAAEEAVRLVRAGAAPVEAPRYLHHLGMLLRKSGRDVEARPLLEDAAARVEARLADLREPSLRAAYAELDEVRTILADGGVGAEP
ncbi:MAG: hypothetical protein D6705_13405 [Deltaproteobacteria bacterium]|nr:MAG: hypothetical protein D6705_13405 [Deltaproteobacteria bacterium]